MGVRQKLVLALLLALLVVNPVFAKYQPPHSMPGPAADRIIFKGGVPVDVAPSVLENKGIDLYLSGLNVVGAKELLRRSDVKVLEAPASSISIVLNPASAPSGELNPFSIRDVRFAMQYLINRDFIVSDIYKGLAAPMVTHVSPFDYDYLAVSDLVKEANIRYDPDLAKRLISSSMTQAGATLENGVWTYNGNPITLKFIIRVEDERRDVGDLVAAELTKLGFTVNRVFQTFGPAISSVYSTDPALFEWNLYTEGWGRGSAERYDFATVNQMCAPWLGSMPGWKEVGFWQYENSTIDQIGQRIFTGNFSGADERNQLYRDATKICLQESVRLWIATIVNSFPATSSMQGLSTDLVGGPLSLPTLREAYIANKTDLTVGSVWVWTAQTIWNPVGGFTDVYSTNIWRNLFDPPTWRHPFTGLPLPFRAPYAVQTGGPHGKIQVPGDAVRWDAKGEQWKSVGQGVDATSKVTFNYKNYFSSKWHDGQPVSMADLFYGIYQTFDLTYNPNKSKVEFAIATVNRPYLDTFRGFRIINDTSVEVYVNFWHFVPGYIAEYASVSSMSMPWEVLYATDNLVFDQRRLAYSNTASERFGVDWLSLVEQNHARLASFTLSQFLDQNTFPQNVFTVGGKVLASAEDAANRYRAAMSWFDKHGHMVISNGPFELAKFDAPSQFAEIDAFRDATYPFKPGDHFYGEPPSIEITKVQGDFITIGKDTTFDVQVRGPGILNLSYVLFDPASGAVIEKGSAQPVANGSFVISLPSALTSKIGPGSYQLVLTASSDAISIVAERDKLLEASTTAVNTSSVVTTGGVPSGTGLEQPQAQSFNFILLAGGVAAVGAAIAGAVFVRRRRRR